MEVQAYRMEKPLTISSPIPPGNTLRAQRIRKLWSLQEAALILILLSLSVFSLSKMQMVLPSKSVMWILMAFHKALQYGANCCKQPLPMRNQHYLNKGR